MFDSFANTLMVKGAEPARWLLVAAIAYTLATTIWTFFTTPETIPLNDPQPTANESNQQPSNINWILGKHLFGEAGAVTPEQISDKPAVETRLPLELQSVFVADVAADSAAIIAQRGKSGLLYHIGASIPGNAKLIEVQTDRVILRRAGVRETLMFAKARFTITASAPAASAQTVSTQAASIQTASTQTEANADPSQPLSNPGNNNAGYIDTQPQADLADYQERLQEDAQGTLDELGIEITENGGYRLGSNAPAAYLQQAGLQPGDVVMSVNGQAVGDIEQDQLELENILARGSARIEVQRGARRFFITVSLGAQNN